VWSAPSAIHERTDRYTEGSAQGETHPDIVRAGADRDAYSSAKSDEYAQAGRIAHRLCPTPKRNSQPLNVEDSNKSAETRK